MASESTNAKQARNRFTKGKRQPHQQIKNRSSISDGDGEDFLSLKQMKRGKNSMVLFFSFMKTENSVTSH